MRRVPCPINPNHSVYERDVKRHLRICPDRRHDVRGLPYFEENCHALRGLQYLSEQSRNAELSSPVVETTHELEAEPDDTNGSGLAARSPISSSAPTAMQGRARFTHRDLSPTALETLCAKVKLLYERHIAPHVIKSHTPLVVSDGTLRVNSKHSTQHESLTKILLERLPSLAPLRPAGHQRVFLELGAGKGGLAYAVSAALSTNSGSTAAPPPPPHTGPPALWMVVDIGGFRRKRDGCVTDTDHKFHRLRINIKDLALNKVPMLVETEEAGHNPSVPPAAAATPAATPHQFVGLGKHLCGACTDFAISCITSRLPSGDSCDAILLATCCHHLCELRHINPISAPSSATTGDAPNQLTAFGVTFSEEEFSAVVSMTSWAVCGSHMVSADKQLIGYACKRVIDYFRVAHLREVCGFDHVELHEYASDEITGENVCIVAWRTS